MDRKTIPSDAYTIKYINISNEDNDASNGTTNESYQWWEDVVIT
jgi:hypothetical protein